MEQQKSSALVTKSKVLIGESKYTILLNVLPFSCQTSWHHIPDDYDLEHIFCEFVTNSTKKPIHNFQRLKLFFNFTEHYKSISLKLLKLSI